jgi:hypothetical protein
MSVWDEVSAGGDYVRFDKVGDSVAGTVTAVRAQRWDDGTVSPQLLLVTDDGEEKTVTAGAIRLKMALAEKRPDKGDHIRITLTDEEKRGGGKTLRHWDVQVTPGNGAAPAAAAPAPAAAAPAPAAAAGTDPAAVAAAVANLSPEQRAVLGL